MRIRLDRQVNIRKAATVAVVVNVMELVVLLLFVGYISFTRLSDENRLAVQALAALGAFMAGWGALLDIREALRTLGRAQKIEDLTSSNAQMEELNTTMRMQRHDFLNHLQVVYGLLEMREYDEAIDYLDKVYGEIRSLSTVLRTRVTAVNALLKVKMAACQDKGISFELDIKSTLEGLSMPSWELCRVLSNLIDNAMDASLERPEPRIALLISEDIRAFYFRIENSGPMIPESMLHRIFEPGVTTKAEGHGMGLYIIKTTLAAYGGGISCESGEELTAFMAAVPKAAQA